MSDSHSLNTTGGASSTRSGLGSLMLQYLRKGWQFLLFVRADYKLHADRYRSRKQLLELDERILRDIGVSRGEAEREAGRGFWD